MNDQSDSTTATQPSPVKSMLSKLRSALSNRRTPADIVEAIDNGAHEAVSQLPAARREMIERVIAFDQKRVDDVMAPRADITAVDIATSLEGLIHAFSEAGHSRLPVYRGDLDDPVGMVHVRDVIEFMAGAPIDGAAKSDVGSFLEAHCRDVLYVPPSMPVTDLLLRMQASRVHMALVIDEYGGTDGLITIEDLVEEIVGEIHDDHDEDDAPTVRVRAGGGWEADARVELDEFKDETGVDLTLEDEEVDTLGGLAVFLAGRVPQRGEVLSHGRGYELEVASADPRKVRKLLIRRGDATAKSSAAAKRRPEATLEATPGAPAGRGAQTDPDASADASVKAAE